MHELSIAMSIVDLVQDEAHILGDVQIGTVHLKLGQLSGVVKDALLSSYEMACFQTPLEGSRLLIEEIPVRVNCPKCHAVRPVASLQWMCCTECGTPSADIAEGRELMVTALEIIQ
ncbi:MAG: hydrogenase maturation nickel metallochaperone HypA [Candidatus Acidiferrales bacterium]|jgi:hydrogenase nickel incorporation protein HypA/HybF